MGVVVPQGDAAYGRDIRHDAYRGGQHLTGDGSAGYPHGGFPGRGTASAPMVAHAVLLVIGIVGMRGTEEVLHGVVIGRMLVFVADEQSDGGAGGAAFEHAGEDLQAVAFLAGGGNGGLSGTTAVEHVLDRVQIEVDPGRDAFKHPADGHPVRFAEGGQAQVFSECIGWHELCCFSFLGVATTGWAFFLWRPGTGWP